MNILLLFGGASNEHEVSLISASYILKELIALQHTIYPVAVHKSGVWELCDVEMQRQHADIHNTLYIPQERDTVSEKTVWTIPAQGVWTNIKAPRRLEVDCVFPIIHGYSGEDGLIQGQLEIAHLTYTGCDTRASAICMNKHITKFILEHFNIPTTPSVTICEQQYRAQLSADYIKECEKTLHYPMIIKPADGGSSIGIYIANEREEFLEALTKSFSLCRTLIVESLLHNVREIETAVINTGDTIKTFLPGEIVIPSKQVYDYTLKYKSNETYAEIPAILDTGIRDKIEHLSKKVFLALGCTGFARIDFFIAEDDTIFVNEVNTIPGFTPMSMFPKIVNQDMSTGELLTAIIDSAMRQCNEMGQ